MCICICVFALQVLVLNIEHSSFLGRKNTNKLNLLINFFFHRERSGGCEEMLKKRVVNVEGNAGKNFLYLFIQHISCTHFQMGHLDFFYFLFPLNCIIKEL